MKSFLTIVLSVAAASLLAPKPATADCYKEVETVVQGGVNCGTNDSVSADFSNVCNVSQSQTVTQRTPVACETQWVNALHTYSRASDGSLTAKTNESAAAACSRMGMVPGMVNGQVCASYQLRPKTGIGSDTIDYSMFYNRYLPVAYQGGDSFIFGSLMSGAFCYSSTYGSSYDNSYVAAYACTQSGKVN